MKLSQLITPSLVLLTGLTISSIGINANASGTKESRDTTAEFEVKAGGEDVTDPIKPIDPIEPPMNGPLSIDAASNFDFGNAKLSAGTGKYEAVKTEGKVLGLQVTDNRGTGKGWKVTSSISDFKTEDNKILKGAELTIPKGSLFTNSVDKGKKPVTAGAKLNSTAATIFTATEGNGMGTWANLFEGDSEKVTLAVPEGNYVGVYRATVTWTVHDTP